MRASLFAAGVAILLASVAGSDAAVAKSRVRIAYSADGLIRVLEPDGSRSRILARGESPSWNPEGTAIAFHSARVRGNGLDIYTMDADGTGQRRIVMHPGGGGEHPINTADDYGPAWSPTGWTIAFTTRRDGNDEIYSMDPIGHRVQRLTDSPASDREPAWSPDGGVIAFVSDRDGNDEIYSLDSRRALRRLTNAPRRIARRPGHPTAGASSSKASGTGTGSSTRWTRTAATRAASRTARLRRRIRRGHATEARSFSRPTTPPAGTSLRWTRRAGRHDD